MWPPVLPRYTTGGGPGAGRVDYADMEQWLPGRMPNTKQGKKHKGDKSTRKPETERDIEVFEDGDERIKVEYYVFEKSCKDRLKILLFKSKNSSFFVLMFLFLLKMTTCVLYVVRLSWDHPDKAACWECDPYTSNSESDDKPPYQCGLCKPANDTGDPHDCWHCESTSDDESPVRWYTILWVDRPLWMWATQVAIAICTLLLTIVMKFLRYKGNFMALVDANLFLEIITTVPFVVTLCWEPLRNLFIPVFLNAWIAKNLLESICNHSKIRKSLSIMGQQVVTVISTLLCLIFTAMCFFQHIQRAGKENYNFFQAFYFIMVTFSTVGYGDICPDVWLSQLLVVLVIFIALGILPKQFEMLASTWMEKQRLGGAYTKSKHKKTEKHCVLCLSTLNPETLLDFLSEFYAYRRLQDHTVVILTQDDLHPTAKQILQIQSWASKVRYIKGTCLREADLIRVRAMDADGVFILSVDSNLDKYKADEVTILNAWAVKDFAPQTRQFIQVFRPENKAYVHFAASVICEDEFKYAMLAYNCLCPGTSTMITLLLHTSRGLEGKTCEEEWIRNYGKCSGNEVYAIPCKDSVIYKEYIGKPFPYASHHGHRKYGVTLIAVKSTHDPEDDFVKLNPGNSYLMRETDICYYLSITREQNLKFTREKINPKGTSRVVTPLSKGKVFPLDVTNLDDDKTPEVIVKGNNGGISRDVAMLINSRGQANDDLDEGRFSSQDDDDSWIRQLERSDIVMSTPPVTPYVGTNPPLCYLLQQKKSVCCMSLSEACEHCSYTNAKEYNWKNKGIILAAEFASNGLYNFILPLRSSVLPKSSLKPIVLLLEREPDPLIMDSISWFPLIYWMLGSIKNIDNMLQAGLHLAEIVVVANRETQGPADADELGDCDTIMAVQSLFKVFPTLKVVTELTSTSMMRFLHFQAGNPFAQYLSSIEKRERDKGSHLSFMFRNQFAAGSVFSANMINTLLYQAVIKDFVVLVIRLMLGIDQTPGSGYLTGVRVTVSDVAERGTYGKMFTYLCTKYAALPIAVYKTQMEGERFKAPIKDKKQRRQQRQERKEIINLVKSRMEALGMNGDEFEYHPYANQVSYVLLSPHSDTELEVGDFLYVLRPSPSRDDSYQTPTHSEGGRDHAEN